MNYLMRIHSNLNGENEDDSEQTAKKSFNCDYVALLLFDILRPDSQTSVRGAGLHP